MNPPANGQGAPLNELLGFLRGLFPIDCHQHVMLVGGSVRDALLDKRAKDLDLVTTLTGSALEKFGFRKIKGVTTDLVWLQSFKLIGNIEITAVARKEDIIHDLRRRDFTVNAIMMTLDGDVIDPLAGRSALDTRTLEPCSSTTFLDDPVRIFRAFRFETDRFILSKKTLQLLTMQTWEDMFAGIPVERFSRELLKALAGSLPGVFFRRMTELNIGSSYLPELFLMPGIPAGPLQHHPEGDLLSHSHEVLERFSLKSDSVPGRFCAFFHDLGKLSTDPRCYPKHHGHDEAGFRAAEQLCRRLALPASYGRALAWISRLHGNANRMEELRPSTRIRMAEQALHAGIAELLPLVSAADKPGNCINAEWTRVLTVVRMSMDKLGVSQQELDGIKPSCRGEFVLQKRVEYLKKATPA